MATNQPDRNDQGASRDDGNAPGTWPGSGTTVDGPVETATSGILNGNDSGGRGSASTSASVQEPDDLSAERRVEDDSS